jgi:hypothetical protein
MKLQMAKDKNVKKSRYGDEAPSLKQFLIVIIVVLMLTALAWSAHKLGLIK